MKQILLFTAIFTCFVCFGEADFTNAYITGTTDKSPLSYKIGEEMIFTFRLNIGDQNADGLFLSWIRKGDDGKIESGKSSATQPLIVKTMLDKPGFVSVNVKVTDAQGKDVKQNWLRWDKTIQKRNIMFYGGTAAEPEKLTDCGEPADFDTFWAKQKARLAAIQFKGKVTLTVVKNNPSYKIYAVSVPCAGRPVTGYLNIPRSYAGKKFPAHLNFHSYGIKKQNVIAGNPHRIIFEINAFGMELGKDNKYYDDFFKNIGGNRYAFLEENNKNPETAFFNGMALRIIRALEYVKTLPEWNQKDLTVYGTSQGGMQALWAASLDSDVTYVNVSVPWCCDLAGTAKKQRLKGWRPNYESALDYYDPVFMVKRIKKAKIEITRAGLGDGVCPPSGLAVCYRNIASPYKSIKWVQGSEHVFVPIKSDEIVWENDKN